MLNLSVNSGNWSEKLLQRIALVAGAFSFVVCILMIANYIQLKKADPANMKVITALVERLNQDPGDNQLREEIRTLDLLSRKAYFTSQWQIRAGGYLLLGGLAVMIMALQWISLSRKRHPVLTGEHEEGPDAQKKARLLVIAGGLVLLATSLLFGFLSHRELKGKYPDVSLLAVTHGDSTEKALPSSGDSQVQGENEDTSDSKGANANTDNGQTLKVADDTKQNVAERPGSNYPTFRGPGGMAVAPQKNIPVDWDGPTGANILWKTAIPLSGYNSPVIWDNKIFLTGASDTKREVYCLDKNNGRILWTAPVANIPGSPSEVPKVSKETGYAAPTAAVNARGVFAIFPNGDLIALDHNGGKLWAKNLGLPQNHYGHSSSLMIYNDLLIIQYDQRSGARIIALSTVTGESVWSTNRQVKVSWSSPILISAGNTMQVITAAEPFVAGYNALTGEELWKLDAISGEVGPSAAFSNGIVFTVNDYSKVVAIKLGAPPEKLWENDEYLSDIPSPVATEKYLFLVTSYGVVVCYDALTGEKYWEKELNNPVFSSPVIAENRVYLMDRTGVMHIFKAEKEYFSIGEPKLGERSACTPAFSNGRIFLRGDKNLFCIGKI
jgi:outer membrane protein assembly factor BamB